MKNSFHALVYSPNAAAAKAEPAPVARAGSRVSHMSGRNPTTQAVTCCFPGCLLAGRWSRNQDSVPDTSLWDVGIPGCVSISGLNVYPRNLHFNRTKKKDIARDQKCDRYKTLCPFVLETGVGPGRIAPWLSSFIS